jgi:hypothetical protein
MSFRDVLEKFVVFDKKEEPSPPVEKAVAPAAASVVSAATAPSSPAASSAERHTGDFDLSGIYRQAGLPNAPFTAEQALETLAALPKELGPDTLRQGLKDLLHAKSAKLGFTTESVAEDAKRKFDTLNAALKSLPSEFAEFITTSEAEIARLTEQIEEKREAIEQAKQQLQEFSQKCRLETERLAKLLQLLG